jgi:hypothetical protein
VKDTPPAIEEKFRQMLLKRSGEERLKMGCSMHATARALAKAALLQKHPDARPAEIKPLLFLHFYGADFEPDERKRIALSLSESAGRAGATRERAASDRANVQVDERPASYRTKRPANRK